MDWNYVDVCITRYYFNGDTKYTMKVMDGGLGYLSQFHSTS